MRFQSGGRVHASDRGPVLEETASPAGLVFVSRFGRVTVRVAVVGASGLAGFAVVASLLEKGIETLPLLASTGNVWRLFSQGIPPQLVYVLHPGGLSRAPGRRPQV